MWSSRDLSCQVWPAVNSAPSTATAHGRSITNGLVHSLEVKTPLLRPDTACCFQDLS